MRPLFSCVMAVKGKRPYYDEAVESLRRQDINGDLEIIIQDADVEPDDGQSDAFNKGFAKARGEWLFWLNADDVLLPGALEKVRKVVRRQDLGSRDRIEWIVGDSIRIDKEGRRIGASVGTDWHDWLFHHAVPHVHGPSSFFRRELLERVAWFDTSLHYCMDWDLWIRFMKAGARYVRVPDFLWGMRQWDGSKTQSGGKRKSDPSVPDEAQIMLKKNNFTVTRCGVWQLRIWRLLCGSLLKQWLNGGK